MGSDLDAFLECGILAHSFLCLHRGDRDHDKLFASSYKLRSFCPSCGVRRMLQAAAHLVSYVMPYVPVRLWVLSQPVTLRPQLAAQPKQVTPVQKVMPFGGIPHRQPQGRRLVPGAPGGAPVPAVVKIRCLAPRMPPKVPQPRMAGGTWGERAAAPGGGA